MRLSKQEKQQQLLEAERNRLMSLSEKELLVEILLTLKGINENSEGIAVMSAWNAFK